MTLEWIEKLENTNCKCSEDYKRDFIKYFLYGYFAFIILNFMIIIASLLYVVYSTYYHKSMRSANNVMKSIMSFMKPIKTYVIPLLFITNIIFSLMYLTQLKNLHSKLECECSKDVRAEIYYYWMIFMAAIAGLFLVGLIILYIMAHTKKMSK